MDIEVPTRYLMNHGQPRKVYMMPLTTNAREFLRGETNSIDYHDWPLEELIGHWRSRWLEMRAANSSVMEKVKSFRKDSLRLTACLDSGGTR